MAKVGFDVFIYRWNQQQMESAIYQKTDGSLFLGFTDAIT